ncbi:hypothetical protein [Psychrobacillus sp.]|nr:hypothetical protein [Psychrobacillus sp.]
MGGFRYKPGAFGGHGFNLLVAAKTLLPGFQLGAPAVTRRRKNPLFPLE